jgi:hypothetical protein
MDLRSLKLYLYAPSKVVGLNNPASKCATIRGGGPTCCVMHLGMNVFI